MSSKVFKFENTDMQTDLHPSCKFIYIFFLFIEAVNQNYNM